MSFRRTPSGLLVPEFNIQVPKILPSGHNLNQMLQLNAPRRRFLPFATRTYSDRMNALGPIAYWRQSETAGANADNYEGTAARDGTYINTPTLNQTGIGDGLGAPLYAPGSSENVDIFSASFETAFDPGEGTLAMWLRMRAASVWTDAVFRCQFTLRVDGSNEIQFQKASGDQSIAFLYAAGVASDQVNHDPGSPTGWFQQTMTWSVTADEMKAFYNGSQVGITQTGLGTWAGSLDSARCRIADRGPGFSPHDGYCAHVAFFDYPLTPAQVLSIGAV